MDLTSSLDELRQRQQQGTQLLNGHGLVLCSRNWPLLVSQVCVLQQGPTVLGACTCAAEGLALVQQHWPDLLLCHDRLEQGSGLELIRQSKAAQPHLKALIIVSQPQYFPWQQALALGIDAACCDQQLGHGVLLEAVRQLCECPGSTFIDPALRRVDPWQSPRLTSREQQILEALQRCEPCKQLARNLGLQLSTVKGYQKQLYSKLGVHSGAEAVRRGLQTGLLQAD